MLCQGRPWEVCCAERRLLLFRKKPEKQVTVQGFPAQWDLRQDSKVSGCIYLVGFILRQAGIMVESWMFEFPVRVRPHDFSEVTQKAGGVFSCKTTRIIIIMPGGFDK